MNFNDQLWTLPTRTNTGTAERLQAKQDNSNTPVTVLTTALPSTFNILHCVEYIFNQENHSQGLALIF